MAVSAASGLISRSARAGDLSLSERVERLYSPRFHFDEDGEPWTTIGLVEHVDEVSLSAASDLEVLPSGPGGTSIRAGGRWRITLERSSPATQCFEVALEDFAPTDRDGRVAAQKKWEALGVHVRVRELVRTRLREGLAAAPELVKGGVAHGAGGAGEEDSLLRGHLQ